MTDATSEQYLTGFGAHFETEAVPGPCPRDATARSGRPSVSMPSNYRARPSRHRAHENRRSWLYRMRPTADHRPFKPHARLFAAGATDPIAPNRLRWDPPADLPADCDFVDGLVTMMVNREAAELTGVAIHLYRATRSMKDRLFVDADGELLIIPQSGTLRIFTEMGRMAVAPGWIGIVPRGLRFRVEVDGEARGYVAENHGALLRLPELGPLGSNGLASARDFETPAAAFEDVEGPCEVIQKYQGTPGRRRSTIVRWMWSPARNLPPPLCELARFNTIGTVSRPSRSVDLHGADLAQRDAGPGQCRFRHLPAALDGGRGHVPAALVPPQRHERGDGPDPWRL